MRSWHRALAAFYVVAGVVFITLGITGGRTDVLRIAFGVVLIAFGVLRYRRAQRAAPPHALTPPDSPPRA